MKINLLSALICSLLLIECVFIFWWVYPYKTIEFKEMELPVLNENKQVHEGGNLLYQVDYIKYTDVGAYVSRQFVDGIIYNLPRVKSSPKKAGEYITIASLEIPHSLSTGKYYLQSEVCYKVNPIREICTTYRTEQFEIVE